MRFKIGDRVLVLSENRKGKVISFDVFEEFDDEVEIRDITYLVKFDNPFKSRSIWADGEILIIENWYGEEDLRMTGSRTSGFGKFIKDRGL